MSNTGIPHVYKRFGDSRKPYYAQVGKKHLGSFATTEDGVAAVERWRAEHPKRPQLRDARGWFVKCELPPA